MDLTKSVQQARLAAGFAPVVRKNEPAEYADKQHEYYADLTERHRQRMLRYASDFVSAEIQMWDENNVPFWITEKLRFANVVRPSSAIRRNFDDYKQIVPENPHIGYYRPGTKIRAMGSTWLVVNPDNISGGEGMSIIRRCNAVWNHLDYYGNLVSEPIIVENPRANASSPDSQVDQLISTGYYNVICQYNEFTRQANDNTRIILGDEGNPYENAKAYYITGYGNFFREFTEEAGSVRLLTFTIRVQTKNDETDDLVNCVAGGKSFRWSMEVTGPANVQSGETAQVFAQSYRNGEAVGGTRGQIATAPSEPRNDSAEAYPISYIWTVSDTDKAVIDQDGNLTAKAPGAVTVTATLAQNTAISESTEIEILPEESIRLSVRFLNPPPPVMGPLDSVVLRAAVYLNGHKTEAAAVQWKTEGAAEGSYYAAADGNEMLLTCYGYSETPLTVTAYHRIVPAATEVSVSANIRLEDV